MEIARQGRRTPLPFVFALILTLGAGLAPIYPASHSWAATEAFAAPAESKDAAPAHDASVGTLAGQAGSNGGAGTYSIPIVVPPGRAGMQPSISLSYSSRSGDGVAGMGWSISGLSSIHRCPQTPEQDGATRGVSYSSTDRLCLDGQRLVSVGGVYGSQNAEYRTEIDSYARIKQLGGTLTTPNTYFTVEQKDGRTLTYGSTATSRVTPAGVTVPLSWLVDKIEDRVGNYQSYSYTDFGNGEVLLGTVTYTGSLSGSAGDRSVTFSYQTRDDAVQDEDLPGREHASDIASSALAGGLTMQTQAVASITTKVGTTTVRKYTPTYAKAQYSGRLLMTALQECAGESSPCHPATLFSYNDDDLNFQLKSLQGFNLASPFPSEGEANEVYRVRVGGDYDGDGTRETLITVSAGRQSGSFLSQFTADRWANVSTSIDSTYAGFGGSSVSESDLDGSGRAALIGLPQLDSANVAFGIWDYNRVPRGAPANRNPFGKVSTNIPLPNVAFGARKQVLAADWDGDGRTDILTIQPKSCGSDGFGPKNGVFFHRNNISGLFSVGSTVSYQPESLVVCLPRVTDSQSPGFAQADIDHIADFNGDGYPDFHLVYTGAANLLTGGIAGVAISNPGANTATIKTCTQIGLTDNNPDFDDCSSRRNYVHRWMDVNADGLEDFVIARPAEGLWMLRLNLGNGTYGPQINTGSSVGLQHFLTGNAGPAPQYEFRYAGKLPAMDVDADGKTDLLTVSQLPGAKAFAVKMCTIKRVRQIGTETCPAGADIPGLPGETPQTAEVCAAYSCPPNPDSLGGTDFDDDMPQSTGGHPHYIWTWHDQNGADLPAFNAYSSTPTHGGVGEDNSVYRLARLKFVQTAPNAFTIESFETPLVSRLNDSYGSADDLFGDGLQDLITSAGCSNLVLTNGVPNTSGYWSHQKCSAVNDDNYGPSTFADTRIATAQLAKSVMLYANVNQGIAAAGGSPGSVGLPASQRPSVPAPTASGSELNLGLLPPYLPGLMDSAINGVNDFVAWGYYPLSVRTTQDSVPLYAFPPGNANGYTDARHYYFQSSMPVVYGMAQNSGDGSINGSRSATYGYTEAMYHHLGRGFQGFRSISSTTQGPSARRLRTTTTFHQKFPLTGRIEKVETLALATNKVIRSETDTWICDITNRGACGQPPTPTSNGGTIFAPQLDTQIVENFDLVTGSNYSTTSTVNAAQPSGGASGWDAYGNLTKQFVKLSDAVISEHRTTTTNSYSPDTSSWWLDRLNSSSVITSQTYSGTHPLPGGAVVPTRNITTSFAWNADHTPQSQTVSASGQTLTTAYDYTGTTAKGLPKSVTISGTGLVDGSGAPAPRTTTFTYTKDGVNTASQDGYFVLTTKNAAQHTSTTEHSTRDGQVTRQVDPNGLKVDNSYDPFGRLVGMSFFDASNAVLLPPVSIGYAKCTSTGCGSGYGDNGSGSQENAAWRVVRTQAGSPTTSDWFDVLGRNIKHTERGFAGDDFIETDTEYDALGTVAMQSGPFYQSEGNGGLTSWTYDALNRPLTKQSPGGELDPANGDVMTTYTYVGSTTNINVRGVHVAETCSTATNLCMNMSRTHDALGRLIKTVQGNGSNGGYATTSYWHDGLGNPVAARDAGDAGGVRAVITSTYNDLGHRIGLNDPDAGIWSFTYNALGELLTQTDARNVVTSHVYDSLGRLTTRTATNSNSTDPNLKVIRDRFIYDQVNGLGMLGTAMRFTGSSEASLGMIWKESNNYQANTSRLERQVSTLQGLAQAWTTSYTYDSSGRLETTTYPSGLAVKKSYTDYGLLQELSDNNTGGVYWHADAQDAWGNVSEETFLGSITGRHSSYASTGQSQQKQWKNGGSLLNRLDYSYDSFGNLKTQSTTQTDIDANETYTYDGLQRLTKTTRSGVPGNPAPVTYDYHPNGNLKFKSDYSTTALSAYTYDAGTCGPHAVTSVARSGGGSDTYTCDANGNVIGGSTLGASYDFNNQPWRVTREGSTAAFAYSADGAVFKSVTGSTTTWFGPGGYEESVVGGTRTQRHELGPVIVLRQNGSDSFKAVLRDRLGSQVMLVNGSPGQSTGLHASPNPSLDGRYTVRWNAMPGASRYELRESINNGLPSLIYNGAGLSWSPPSPKPIGTYRYTLRVCSPVCAADSAPVTEEVVPGAPTGLNLNPNPSSTGTFALSWSPVAGALLYQVEEKAETDADFHAVAMVSDPPGAAGPSWQASGKPTGDYQYRVRSCLTLCGNPSAIVTEVVTGGGGGQAPGAPFMNPPGAGSNTGQIALSWTPAAAPSPQPDYYAVQENGGYNIHVPSGTSLSLTRGNGTFTYKVRGCRNNPANPYAPFCGAYSNTVSVTVNASSIPAAPASISSTLVGCSEDRTNVEYAINWASSTGATSYELTETSDYDGDSDHTFTVFTTSQGFVHSTPPGETSITYSYTVKACNASGCSQDRGGAYACIGDDSNEPNGPDSTPIATAYDAFGKVRNGDYSDRPGGKLNLLPDTVRGFTGHQHVDDVRLIHMNGRVYDYQLGRFLSVDPIIQFPANSQSLNPYSYIMNNPLSGRDPSGYAVSSDDEIGHGVTMGVKTVYDFESVRQEAARASITGNGSEKQSTRVASASAAEATAPSSQKGVNNSTAPTAPMPITEDDYLKDPRGFWEGIPVSKGYSNDEQVRKAGDAVNSSHAKNTGDIQSTPEQRDFIKRIAKPTSVAQAEINYASKVKTEFYIQVAQNENGTFSIVGAARIPQGGRLERLPATTLVAHWHYAGLTQYPGRGDHSAPRNAGIPGFVITRDARSSRCCNMYEVGRQSGQYVYRSVAQDRPGSWKENSHWKDGE